MSRTIPVSEGQVVQVKISGTTHKGVGIGKYEGFTLFVPHSLPGESVICEIISIKKGFAETKLKEVTERSEWRQEPVCPDFYQCGGSHLQHVNYGGQLLIKQQIVKDIVERIGKVQNPQVLPVIGMDKPWDYRNKASFQVVDEGASVRIGFFEEESHEITVSHDCMLLHPQIREVAALVEQLLNKYKILVYDWKTGKGLLRHVVLRRSWAHNKTMVVFVTTSSDSVVRLLALSRELAKESSVVSIVRNINDSPGRAVFGNKNQVLAGIAFLEDKLGNLEFRISPTSFYQVNPVQTEVLYEKVRDYTVKTGEETVLDLYCGIGTISLYLAKYVKKVIGLEVHVAATDDAAVNARENNIKNVEFIVGRAEDRLPKLVTQGIRPEVVVVDPPRKGVDKRALVAIAEMAPERIVYVSCDPASMARDVDFLRHRGYELVEVQPVDMFPQTFHVECVVLIERK